MEAAADLYTDKMSLQAIADALALNPIKVRKLLITAGVYESDTAKLVPEIRARGRVPLIVGGTMLYAKACGKD